MPTPRRAGPVTFLVDPSMYNETYLPPRQVYGSLEQVVRPDLFYHYSSPICAQRWMDVCEDPAYGHVRLLDCVGEAMTDVVAALLTDSGGKTQASLCSLGPGDGSVDVRMLQALGGVFSVTSYTALDFSFELLRRSVNRIAGADGIPLDLAIRAVCGDFTDLGTVTLQPHEPDTVRVFALTGFTFGNYPEHALLENIGSLMESGDYLFIDARLHALGGRPGEQKANTSVNARPEASYDLETVRRFVLGPVELATTAEISQLPVSFELARPNTSIPGAVKLVIYCSGLDTYMRLTGERVYRDRLDLAVTTSYNLAGLVSWLERSSLSTVWRGESNEVAFFLLKK